MAVAQWSFALENWMKPFSDNNFEYFLNDFNEGH